MAIKFENVEEIKSHEAGEYLMKITKAEEKTFKSGNSALHQRRFIPIRMCKGL